jgi:hypothetical protein
MSVPWPGGARCAACVSWDVDADTLVLHRRPHRGHELHGGLSWLRYDEVAVPEIVKVLDGFGIRQTFLVCAWCIERYPAMCEPIVASGHEIAYHGYLHEAPSEQPPERELYELQRGIEIIWFATLDEIACHVRSCVDAGTYVPRVVSLRLAPLLDGDVTPGALYVEES